MKKFTSGRIKELLASRDAGQAPDAEAFWSDFKARAKLVNQDMAGQPATASFAPGWWAAATACAALLIVAGGVLLYRGGSRDDTADEMTLDVTAAHSAVLVIEDEASQGTIVWIVGMEEEESGGGRA